MDVQHPLRHRDRGVQNKTNHLRNFKADNIAMTVLAIILRYADISER